MKNIKNKLYFEKITSSKLCCAEPLNITIVGGWFLKCDAIANVRSFISLVVVLTRVIAMEESDVIGFWVYFESRGLEFAGALDIELWEKERSCEKVVPKQNGEDCGVQFI